MRQSNQQASTLTSAPGNAEPAAPERDRLPTRVMESEQRCVERDPVLHRIGTAGERVQRDEVSEISELPKHLHGARKAGAKGRMGYSVVEDENATARSRSASRESARGFPAAV